MFTSLTDDEFLEIVMKVLSKHGIEHADIKNALECKLKRSFSLICKRYMRCMRETVFVAHDMVIAENSIYTKFLTPSSPIKKISKK